MNPEQPLFPISVLWPHESAEAFESEEDLCLELEWFNSECAKEPTAVIDAQGRAVRLLVEALEIKALELK